ncbi:hypothetical protein GCM10010501_10910 [Streptomyces libani subsp. rufus]|nr:hypothetical protein GCM10010501_10910 [Streptomyces libani subsp. rufus]
MLEEVRLDRIQPFGTVHFGAYDGSRDRLAGVRCPRASARGAEHGSEAPWGCVTPGRPGQLISA